MNTDAIEDELLSPVGLREKLLGHGLVAVEMTTEEFELAQGYGVMFPRLSVYDRIALAIAKARDIFLLTGDAALRKVAQSERVEVKGTLGILDELVKGNLIDRNEYEHCLSGMLNHNGRGIRLPKNEITLRLQKLLKKVIGAHGTTSISELAICERYKRFAMMGQSFLRLFPATKPRNEKSVPRMAFDVVRIKCGIRLN